VAIASDVSDSTAVARALQQADPTIGILLLGESPGSLDALAGRESVPSKALSALSQEQAYVRSLLHTVDAVIIMVGLDGHVREWNRRAEVLSGIPRAEAIGRSFAELAPEHERERVRADIERLAAGGGPTERFETVVSASDGSRHLLWNASLVEDQQGHAAILATGIDLTEQKRAERALQDSQRRVIEAEKLAAITALTGGIAHDIGTPMTAILGYAELLAKSVDDEKNRKRANTIVEQVHRVSDLLETLLNLSRLEDRPQQPVELERVAEKALDFYREKFKLHGVALEREYEPAPRILGDADRLHQVLLSLFLSALEVAPNGSPLRVAIRPAAGGVELRVSHRGPGPGEPDPRAPLFGGDDAPPAGATGIGFGLLVARSIVEEHGGRIALVRRGGGSEFQLSFPLAREPASTPLEDRS
jgi:PAS domain S-box-containing protein